MTWNWASQPAKMWLGFMVLLSAHHFVIYSRQVADEIERECEALERAALSCAMAPAAASAGLR
jgi:hypothetical protein